MNKIHHYLEQVKYRSLVLLPPTIMLFLLLGYGIVKNLFQHQLLHALFVVSYFLTALWLILSVLFIQWSDIKRSNFNESNKEI